MSDKMNACSDRIRYVRMFFAHTLPAQMLLTAVLVVHGAQDQSKAEPTARQAVLVNNTVSTNLDSFTVLDLDVAQRIALTGNPSLSAVRARVAQAQAAVRQVRATYWPSVDVGVGVSRIELADDSIAPTGIPGASSPGQTDPEEYYQAQVSAVWLLFDGFARRFSTAAAAQGEQEIVAAVADTQRQLCAAVADTYFSAQLARENESIARADESFNKRVLKEAEARYRAGQGPLSDQLGFQVRVNAAKDQVIRARLQYELAIVGLSALMGLKDAALPAHIELASLTKETSKELVRPDVTNLTAHARQRRPDLLQGQCAVRRLEAETRAARADLLPSLALSATVESKHAGNPGLEQDDVANTVALTLSMNLLDGGLARAVIRQKEAGTAEAERLHDALLVQVAAEVRESVARVIATQEELELQRSNAALVEQTRDLVAKEYAAGQTALVRLNEAQKDMILAQGRLASSLINLRKAWFALTVATGQTTD